MMGVYIPGMCIARAIGEFVRYVQRALWEEPTRSFSVFRVHADGYRSVIDKGNLHIGPELSGPDGLSNGIGKGLAELLVEGNGQFVTGCSDIGGTVAFPGGSHQRELADDYDLASGLQDTSVHNTFFIVEDSEPGDFLHQVVNVLFPVFVPDSEKNEEPRADGRLDAPVDGDGCR